MGAMALDFGDSRAEAGGESQEEGENSGRSGRFGNRGGSASDAGRFERGRGGRREADRNSDRNTRIKVRVHDKHSFQVAKEPVDLRFVEQLADSEQTAALAQMVRYCLEKGLLERRINPQSRRECQIFLTEEGRETAAEVCSCFRETEKKMCSGLTEKELKALDAGICRMLENLTEA